MRNRPTELCRRARDRPGAFRPDARRSYGLHVDLSLDDRAHHTDGYDARLGPDPRRRRVGSRRSRTLPSLPFRPGRNGRTERSPPRRCRMPPRTHYHGRRGSSGTIGGRGRSPRVRRNRYYDSCSGSYLPGSSYTFLYYLRRTKSGMHRNPCCPSRQSRGFRTSSSSPSPLTPGRRGKAAP